MNIDASGSMYVGNRMKKSKALLLGICQILEKEKRALHIVLFGAIGELKELVIKEKRDYHKIMQFLNNGFGGGTDFKTPIERNFEILERDKTFEKSDILMITDCEYELSREFITVLKEKKKKLHFNIYTVVVEGHIHSSSDEFSDERIAI